MSSRWFRMVASAPEDRRLSRKGIWSGMKRTFSASAWGEGDWHVAQCLEVDVAGQGEQEALEGLHGATELYFEPPGPTATPRARTIEVEVGAA